MAGKRLRCVCGKVYDPASHSSCPECQTPAPVLSAVEAPLPVEPPPPRIEPEKLVLLDSDRKKRPLPYLFTPMRMVGAAICLAAFLGGVWLVSRSHPKPIPDRRDGIVFAEQTKSVSPDPPTSLAAGADLAAVIAKAKPGATINLAAGTYRGSFSIAQAIRLVGNSASGPVVIQNENTSGLAIKAAGVILENIRVTNEGAGRFAAVVVGGNAATLELRQCIIDTPGTIGVVAENGSKLTASNTTFTTRGQGSGCQIEDASSAKLTDCVFKDNQWGYSAMTGSQGYATNCQFEQNGLADGDGITFAAAGAKTFLVAEKCTFNNNPSGALAREGGTVLARNCTFTNNGVSGKEGSAGVMCARQTGRLVIHDSTFNSNRQGIALTDGGTAEIEHCTFTDNGLVSDNPALQFCSHTISASGEKTEVTITKTTITKSLRSGINIVEGASLQMEDSKVSAGVDGLAIGLEKTAHCEAIVVRCQFTDNKQDGVSIFPDSFVKFSDSVASGNGVTGIYLKGEKAVVMAENSEINKNGECGVLADANAYAVLVGCNFYNNVYGAQAGVPKSDIGAIIILNHCKVRGSTEFGVGAMKKAKVVLDNCTIAENKNNVYQARGGVIVEETQPSDQTGGKTGVAPTR